MTKLPKVISVVGSNSSKYPKAVWVLPVFQGETAPEAKSKTKNVKKAGNSGAYLGELAQTALAEHELMQLENIVAREPELSKPNSIRIAHCNHDHSISLTVVLVGLGQKEHCTLKTLKKASEAAGKATQSLHAQQVVWGLLHDACHNHPNLDLTQATTISVQALLETHYRFEACKKAADPALTIPEVLVYGQTTHRKALETGIARATALAHGTALCKDLGNLPSNICTPVFLANLAQDLASHYKLKLDVLTPTQMEKLGMHSLLSVGKASINPPRLIVLEYRGPGAGKQAPIVLLGKGITFDTGGISLKPGAAMDEMKYDMCGAASVLSTLKVCCELRLPINLTVVVVAAENMPAGNASKPGDIVVSMSGQTIEILNTDAEGRLILCDALTYIQRFKPEVVIDVATLTGACVVALGHVMSGLYSPQEHLAKALMNAGKQALDPAWQMPLDETYAEQLKSNFADMANIGGPPAGSVTAACFLQKFVDGFDWAHLDIAGTAWRGGEAKGATGRPVSLLSQYLIQRCYPDAP